MYYLVEILTPTNEVSAVRTFNTASELAGFLTSEEMEGFAVRTRLVRMDAASGLLRDMAPDADKSQLRDDPAVCYLEHAAQLAADEAEFKRLFPDAKLLPKD